MEIKKIFNVSQMLTMAIVIVVVTVLLNQFTTEVQTDTEGKTVAVKRTLKFGK